MEYEGLVYEVLEEDLGNAMNCQVRWITLLTLLAKKVSIEGV